MQFSSALKRTMYDFKNSFFPNFLLIHRAKYVFSIDMFCLYHFRAKIHSVTVVDNSGELSLFYTAFSKLVILWSLDDPVFTEKVSKWTICRSLWFNGRSSNWFMRTFWAFVSEKKFFCKYIQLFLFTVCWENFK